MAAKYKSSYWTNLWRAIYKLQQQGIDADLIADLQSNLRELDLKECGQFYFLDEDDLPSHIWYVAVYDDDSVRVQVRSGPSLGHPNLASMLIQYPMLQWVADARRDCGVQTDNAVA